MADDRPDPREALQRKQATMQCPACGRREWASSGQAQLIAEPRTEIYLLSCKWCGYVRMHDLDFLLED